jgi:hypothetical protein
MKHYVNNHVQNGALPNGLIATLILQKRKSELLSRRGKRKGAEYIASNSNTPPEADTGSLGSTNENDLPSPAEEEKNTVDTTGNAKNLGETSNTVDTTGNTK